MNKWEECCEYCRSWERGRAVANWGYCAKSATPRLRTHIGFYCRLFEGKPNDFQGSDLDRERWLRHAGDLCGRIRGLMEQATSERNRHSLDNAQAAVLRTGQITLELERAIEAVLIRRPYPVDYP